MLHWAALLTAVASLIVGHHVPVSCAHPPGTPWTGRIYGYAVWPPEHIYLRDCRNTVRLRYRMGVVYSHEILHVEHKRWPHWRIYATADWYWLTVVRRELWKEEHGLHA